MMKRYKRLIFDVGHLDRLEKVRIDLEDEIVDAGREYFLDLIMFLIDHVRVVDRQRRCKYRLAAQF